ncbi:septal ring lytic transglycosylase RlpA family protein [Altererythrobacter sp. ZODW24]|uniref:septal ring lytic transglycosylase RlpA family protein n=1 Tax=Altererythrobacter sp. ZODW24 TaxID=2185142 RepID=UPI000DF778A5|nr:septal ring lytic transglycosylase RlpA family protein [Altererythrobacter sp. ZODW24]
MKRINPSRSKLGASHSAIGSAALVLAFIIAVPVNSALFAQDAVVTESPASEFQQTFAESFEAFETLPAASAVAADAVDITTITPPIEVAPKPEVGVRRTLGTGVASYYGKRFAGRKTANGERFNPRHMTAAHKTLPFGSKVRVTNPRNGKSVIVRINDRGPFIRGRHIDLSRAAAERIGLIQRGHGKVEMALLR